MYVHICMQGSGGLTSQQAQGQHSYASITSESSPSSPGGEVPNSKSHASHVTSLSESHDQRQLYSVDDEDDDRPPQVLILFTANTNWKRMHCTTLVHCIPTILPTAIESPLVQSDQASNSNYYNTQGIFSILVNFVSILLLFDYWAPQCHVLCLCQILLCSQWFLDNMM